MFSFRRFCCVTSSLDRSYSSVGFSSPPNCWLLTPFLTGGRIVSENDGPRLFNFFLPCTQVNPVQFFSSWSTWPHCRSGSIKCQVRVAIQTPYLYLKRAKFLRPSSTARGLRKGAPCPRCVYAALHACDVALRIRRVPWHTLTAPTLADMLLGTLMEDEEGLTRSEAH